MIIENKIIKFRGLEWVLPCLIIKEEGLYTQEVGKT